MDTNYWIQIVISILTGVSILIPLIIKLVNVVKQASLEKNWNLLIKMAMDYMVEAEKNIATGAERKKWVVSMVIASAANINYPLTNEDIQKLEDLVDAICDASKVINNPVASNKVLEESQDKTEKTETSK